MSLARNILYAIVALAIGFVVGYLCHTQTIIETTVTRVDTLTIEKPIPCKEEVIREVSVPVYVSTPSDTVVVVKHDTVYVNVEVERREYRNEQYRAVISGAKIGDLRPTLEDIEIYSRTTTSIVEKKKPFLSPYVTGGVYVDGRGISAGGGIFIRDKVGVGAEAILHKGEWSGVVRCTYKF